MTHGLDRYQKRQLNRGRLTFRSDTNKSAINISILERLALREIKNIKQEVTYFAKNKRNKQNYRKILQISTNKYAHIFIKASNFSFKF